MNINNIINQGGSNVQIVVSAGDLKEFFLELACEREKQASLLNESISLKETLDLLGVTKTTLWRWEKNGYLQPSHVGRKVFYKKADIERITGKRV